MINLFGLANVLEGFASHISEETKGGADVFPVYSTRQEAIAGLKHLERNGKAQPGPIQWAVAQDSNHWQVVGWNTADVSGDPVYIGDSMEPPFEMQFPGHGWCQTFAAIIGVAIQQASRRAPSSARENALTPGSRVDTVMLTLLRKMNFEVGPSEPPGAVVSPEMNARYLHNSRVAAEKWLSYLPSPMARDPIGIRDFMIQRLSLDCGILAMVRNIVNNGRRKVSVNSGDGTPWSGWSANEIRDEVEKLELSGKARSMATQLIAKELAAEAYARIYALLEERAVNPVRDFGNNDCKPPEITSDIGMPTC